MLPHSWESIVALQGLSVAQIEESIAAQPALSQEQKDAFVARVETLIRIAQGVYGGSTFAVASKPFQISKATIFRWLQAFQKKGLSGLIPICKRCSPKNLAGRKAPTVEQMRSKAKADMADILAMAQRQGKVTVSKPGK